MKFDLSKPAIANLIKNGLSVLEACIKQTFDEIKTCRRCENTSVTKTYSFETNLLLVDMEYVNSELWWEERKIENDKKIARKAGKVYEGIKEARKIKDLNLPKVLEINDNHYQLKGVVEYAPGHFKAFCYVNNVWIRKDDVQEGGVNLAKDIFQNLPEDKLYNLLVYLKC